MLMTDLFTALQWRRHHDVLQFHLCKNRSENWQEINCSTTHYNLFDLIQDEVKYYSNPGELQSLHFLKLIV